MSLKSKINEDINVALKNGETDTVSSLRFLMSVIKNKELEKRTKLSKEGRPAEELEKLSELSDDGVVSIILGEIKKRKESITQYESGGREELARKEIIELEILKKYVPEEMSGDELRSIVKKRIDAMGDIPISDFGKIMGSVMADVKGRAGGDTVKKIIEEELKNEP